MACLNRLIKELEQLHAEGVSSPALQFIPSLSSLITVLRKINNLVSLESFKNTVAKQFKFFTANYLRYKAPLRDDFLNAGFYGSPGVGKTECGKLLSEFWMHCGLTPKKESSLSLDNFSLQKKINRLYLVAKTGEKGLKNGPGQRLLRELSSAYEPIPLPIGIPEHPNDTETFQMPKSGVIVGEGKEETFTVYTRGDFVGCYQGWSSKKTREIIERNIGKVIMVDEAYTLITDDNDTYGKEAVTEIVNFMDKHPGKIRWIFAGYREDIEKGLFRLQPGLRRRFNWFFDINPYNAADLSLIFRRQMENRDWSCPDKEFSQLKGLFGKWFHLLRHGGGSTKQLCYFVESHLIEDNWDLLLQGKTFPREFTCLDVKNALMEFSKVSLASEESLSSEIQAMYI
jgi:hypothetical protein